MPMNRSSAVAWLVTVVVSSAAADSAPTPTQLFLSSKWVEVPALHQVKPAIIRALTGQFGEDRRLAGSGEPFDASDLVSGLPTRRFILAGHAQTLWFVAYEHGGRGHHLVLAVFDDQSTPPKPLLVATGTAGVHNDIVGWKVSLEQLRASLRSGALSAGDLNDHNY